MATDETKINWEFRALADLADIHEYISEVGSEYQADQYIERIFTKVAQLKTFPERYPPCRHPKLKAAGFRCINFEKRYIIFYKVEADVVKILAVINAKRDLDHLADAIIE